MTNIFGGYYDWKVNGGQRWLSASGVTKGNLAEARTVKQTSVLTVRPNIITACCLP